MVVVSTTAAYRASARAKNSGPVHSTSRSTLSSAGALGSDRMRRKWLSPAKSASSDTAALWRSSDLGVTMTSGFLNGRSIRSEEHTSELQSLMRISYAVFCLQKKKNKHTQDQKYRL